MRSTLTVSGCSVGLACSRPRSTVPSTRVQVPRALYRTPTRVVQHAAERRCRCRVASERATPDTQEPAARVEEIMVPHPICFHREQTVKEAARLMIEKDISGGPVVDSEGHLCGFLSEGDLMWKGAGAPLDHFIVPPTFLGAFDLWLYLKDNDAIQTELKKVLAKKVSDAMTKNVFFTTLDATMSDASTIMLKHKVNSLPVVDDSKVVGILTRHDVLRALIATHSPLLE